MAEARDQLTAFAMEIIRASWEGCDGGDIIQELAEKHGLIKRVPFDPAVHIDQTGFCEAGDPWFVFALPSPPEEDSRG
jgi:phage protein D